MHHHHTCTTTQAAAAFNAKINYVLGLCVLAQPAFAMQSGVFGARYVDRLENNGRTYRTVRKVYTLRVHMYANQCCCVEEVG